MGKSSNRTVHKRDDGGWGNRRNGNKKDTSVHSTQKEAIDAARTNLQNQGGGELTIQGTDGKIREKDTIPPGNDPYPPKG